MPTYIIFDLEFMVVRKHQHLADIIEIGAIKMTEQEGRLVMTDVFHSYVKPSRQYKLAPETTPFTGITQDQVDQAPSFPEALKAFQEWIGEAPYYLCAHGGWTINISSSSIAGIIRSPWIGCKIITTFSWRLLDFTNRIIDRGLD